MKKLLPTATTLLSMPRKPLIISILLLVGFGFMLVGGWSNHAWAVAGEADGKIVRIMVDNTPGYPNGRVFIELSPLPSKLGNCIYPNMTEFDTNDESYKSLLSAAFIAYTSGTQVKIYYDDAQNRCRIYTLWLQPR